MFALMRTVFVLWRLGGRYSWVLAGIWLAYPFAVRTVIDPRGIGEAAALLVLVALSLLQLDVTVLFYRRAQFFVALWPFALLVGCIANLVWFWCTGYFDLVGALAGITPLVSAVVCLGACEKLGADFVFGDTTREPS